MDEIDRHYTAKQAEALRKLLHTLRVYRGKPITKYTLERMCEHIEQFRTRYKLAGVVLPKLVPLAVPGLGEIVLMEVDATHEKVQSTLRRLIAKYPYVPPTEWAQAVRRAFPDYVPKISIDEGSPHE